jgi:regulator of nucleoside diphosphate kinase
MLTAEIERAVVVTPQEVPPDVVTMNSVVCIRDSANGGPVTYTLLFPWNAALSKNKISVLASIGTALLGEPQGT